LDCHIAGDMRIVVDTNVVVTAFQSPSGATAEVIRSIRRGELTMLATVALFLEYEAVLTRPEHLAKAEMTIAQANRALDVLAALVHPVKPHFLWRPRLRDADDMVLEAAVNGRADAIVTFNLSDFADAVSEFGLDLLTPVAVLRNI
jgi:putative PIN family toxin of toxin-antitoxin system